MDFAYTAEDEAFRDRARRRGSTRTCRSSSPSGPSDDARGDGRQRRRRGSGIMGAMERRRAWQRKLNEGRWAAITWPAEWGGRDATVTQNVIYSEDDGPLPHAGHLQRQRPVADRADDHPLGHRRAEAAVGAQHPRRRRPLVPGVHRAARPAAISPTSARSPSRDGDDYVAQRPEDLDLDAPTSRSGACSSCAPTRRRSSEARKHEGITALIIDLERRGIDIRPIRDISGEEMFCEVFFTDARVPVDYRLGEEGEGWLVAMGTLGYERVGTAGLAIGMRADLDAHGQPRPVGEPRRPRRPGIRDAHRAARTPTSSTRGCSTTAPCRRSSRTRRTGPRCRWPSCSGRYLAQTLAELAVDLLGPSAIWPRAGRMPSTAEPGTASTCSSATRRSAPARPRCRRTSSPTGPSSFLANDPRLEALDHRRVGHASAFAHGLEAVTPADRFEVAEQGGHDANA